MAKIPTPTKLPSGKWNVKMMVNGHRYSVTASTKRDVEYEARQMKERLLLNGNPYAKVTLGEAIDRWLDKRTEILSPTTQAAYRSYRRNHFQEAIDCPVTSEIDWQGILNEESKKYSPKTVKNVWGLLVPVLEENHITVPKVRLPQMVMKERTFLEPEQIHPFLDIIRGDMYELPYLLGLQSLRQSEVLAITREKITDTHIIVHGSRVKTPTGLIYKETNKTDSSWRSTRIVISRILEIADDFDYSMFTTKNPEVYTKHLKVITRENGLPELTMHTLRHTWVTLCFYLDIDPYDCMLWGGWHDIMTINNHYRHLAAQSRKESEQKLISFFENRKMG